jgi:energy-coupling factor transport system permease/ATP-binding protein
MPIHIENLSILGDGQKQLLDRVTATLADQSITLIIGRAGSGKTTLLRALAGLTQPANGTIRYGDRLMWSRKKVNRELLLESSIAFQFPEHQLFARTVQEELDYSLRPYRLPKPKRLQRSIEALEGQRLPASVLSRSPFLLSGGQKRRVALASVTAAGTPWLLLDEPTAGLDAKSLTRLKDQLVSWKQSQGIVIATHDFDAFLPIADRVLIISQGKLAADLTPQELTSHPDVLIRNGVGLTESMKVMEELKRAGLPIPIGLAAPSAEQLAFSLLGIDQAEHPAPSVTHQAYPETNVTHSNGKDQEHIEEKTYRPTMSQSENRFIYRLDVKWKWLIYSALSLTVILQKHWLGLGIGLAMAAYCLALLSPHDIRRLLRMSKPLLVLIAVAVLFSGLRVDFEQGLHFLERFSFAMDASTETLRRLLILFAVTIFGLVFTLSTSTSAMKHGLSLLLRPFKRIGAPTELLALAASLVLRFIPLIMEEADRFALISKARGKRTSRRGQIHLRDIPVFVIPLLIALFQAVEELILALELKGYTKEGKL